MHSSFSWSQQEQLINRIEEPNSVYTHFLIMIIDNLRDELENEIDLLERSTKQDYIDLKKKEITVLNKSRDMATNALKKHIEKTNLDLEESIQSVAFYDKKLENLKLERLHIIDLEKEKNSTLRNSKFSAEKMILDEIFKYVSKLISKDQLILKKMK